MGKDITGGGFEASKTIAKGIHQVRDKKKQAIQNQENSTKSERNELINQVYRAVKLRNAGDIKGFRDAINYAKIMFGDEPVNEVLKEFFTSNGV